MLQVMGLFPLPTEFSHSLHLLRPLKLLGVIEPCQETDAVVHLNEEWIETVFASCTNFAKEPFLQVGTTLVDRLHGDVKQFELRDQFSNLHLLVKAEVAVSIA